MNLAQGKIAVPTQAIKNADLVMQLLEQVSTKDVVINFLKKKSLHHSGTWLELREKRILPAIESGKVSLPELIELLSEAEETGRQHVFLYQLPEILFKGDFSVANLKAKVQSSKFSSLVDEPVILDKPDNLTLNQINFTSQAVTFKAISTRVSYGPSNDRIENGKLIKEYDIQKTRAVSLLKIHENGLCEVRISSKSSSVGYGEDIREFLRLLNSIFDWEKITAYPVNLAKAKSNIWDQRESLREQVRFSDATLTNGLSVLRAATGTREADLLDDEQVSGTVKTFVGDNVCCDSNNIFLRPMQGQSSPTKEIHILMTGEINEVIMTTSCSTADYEYSIGKILAWNND